MCETRAANEDHRRVRQGTQRAHHRGGLAKVLDESAGEAHHVRSAHTDEPNKVVTGRALAQIRDLPTVPFQEVRDHAQAHGMELAWDRGQDDSAAHRRRLRWKRRKPRHLRSDKGRRQVLFGDRDDTSSQSEPILTRAGANTRR